MSPLLLLTEYNLIIIQVVGMNWIEVPAGKYMLNKGNSKKSQCQIELTVKYVVASCSSFEWH